MVCYYKCTKGVTAVLFNIVNDRRVHDIPIINIKSCRVQSRKIFPSREMKMLAQSIRVNGVLQPLMVRKLDAGEYELISGERRLRAAVMCGNRKVPCIVMRCRDDQADVYSLTENINGSGLNCFEAAEGIDNIIKTYDLSRFEVSKRLGISQSELSDKLELLNFTPEEQDLIIKYRLTERHARNLLRIEDIIKRKMILSDIISKGMNVTQTDRYIDSVLNENKDKENNQKTTLVIKDIKILENTIRKAADTIEAIGIKVFTSKKENDDSIEYVIRIPKQSSQQEKSA